MLDETAQELNATYGHSPMLVAVGIIFPAEDDTLIGYREQPVIADGNAVSVAAQVTKYLGRSAECWLGIHNPVLGVERSEKAAKLTRAGKRAQCTAES